MSNLSSESIKTFYDEQDYNFSRWQQDWEREQERLRQEEQARRDWEEYLKNKEAQRQQQALRETLQPQVPLSAAPSAVAFSMSNVDTIASFDDPQKREEALKEGKVVPVEIPDENNGGNEILLYQDDRGLAMRINGNEIRVPENIKTDAEIQSYGQMIKNAAKQPFFAKILSAPYHQGLKYFEEKFRAKYPNEKMGARPNHFYEVIFSEIAEASGIDDLKVE